MIDPRKLRRHLASLQCWLQRTSRWRTAAAVNHGAAVGNWPRLSMPMLTAGVAAIATTLLLVDVLARLAPLPEPAATATPIGAAAPRLIAQVAEPVRRSRSVPNTLTGLEALPEPAAGPAGPEAGEDDPASGGTRAAAADRPEAARLPVIPEVPAELDDIAKVLQRRRAEVLELEAGLALRAAALRAAEADLAAQIDRLEAFQRQLEALVGAAEAEEEERLQQLVKMYESMRAKSAAAIFDRLEMPVILAVAKRMREARMAAILAAMDPNRARLVTTELAEERELPRLD